MLDDTPNGVRLYRFAKPLATGDTLTVRFAGRFEPRGYPNDAFNNDVAYNGSFMNSSTSRASAIRRATSSATTTFASATASSRSRA